MTARPPLIIVDAANVVGSRPDGWWRDRRAATRRLRDRLHDLHAHGLPRTGPDFAAHGPVDVLLVTEGKARGVESTPTVTVVDATGTADDHIAALVADQATRRPCLVITSDRELRDRVHAAGGHTRGVTALTRDDTPHTTHS